MRWSAVGLRGECGTEGLIGRFPAVSVWVYWWHSLIGQIWSYSHLELTAFHKGNLCSTFALNPTHQNVIHACAEYMGARNRQRLILFLLLSSLYEHILIIWSWKAFFFSKMQRNTLGTFYLHFKVNVYRGQPWPFPLLCFNEPRSLCKNVLISAAPVTNSQKWLISGKIVPLYWGLSWTKGSINASLWLHNQPWKSKWTLLGNITSTVSTDL